MREAFLILFRQRAALPKLSLVNQATPEPSAVKTNCSWLDHWRYEDSEHLVELRIERVLLLI